MQSLSDEQRDMVLANLGLAHAVALGYGRRRRLQEADLDLARSASLEGLCLAAAHYDRDRDRSFATFAGACCRNAIRREFCGTRARHAPRVFLADAMLYGVEAHAGDPAKDLGHIEDLDRFRAAISALPPRDLRVILLRIEGWTRPEIGEALGLTRQAVSAGERRAARRLRAILGHVDAMPEVIRRAPKSSRFRGVSWRKDLQKWQAFIMDGQRRIALGTYAEEERAALAYNAAAVKLRGESARLNVIESTTPQ